MKIIIYLILTSLILNSCSQVRKSAGVNRKSIDEFQVVENPPLVIPPDFNILPPDQLEEKRIDDIEKELAQEILFGLDEEELKAVRKTLSDNQDVLEEDFDAIEKEVKSQMGQAGMIESGEVVDLEQHRRKKKKWTPKLV